LIAAVLIAPAIGIPFCSPLAKFNPILYLLPYLLMLLFGVPYILQSFKTRQLTLKHYLMGGHLGASIAGLAVAIYFGIAENIGVGFFSLFVAYFVAIIPCLIAAAISWKIVAADIQQ